MKKLSAFLMILIAICCLSSCEKEAEAVAPQNLTPDDWQGMTFTAFDPVSGQKTGERIIPDYFAKDQFFLMNNWQFQEGDLIFFRGRIQKDTSARYNSGYPFAIVPLESGFYWNGVAVWHDGFLYRITPTDDGLRIYNQGLWTLERYCVLVQASPTQAVAPDAATSAMMANIHKVPVRRGHIKKSLIDATHDKHTPAGYAWGYYKNKGKNIKPDGSGEFVRAEDFITKTDAANGYFESATPDLTIRNVQIFSSSLIDCSKVY